MARKCTQGRAALQHRRLPGPHNPHNPYKARIAAAVLTGIALAAPVPAPAHPGGLDANGCHHDRRTGDYHCHRARSTAPQPLRQSRPDNGNGNGGGAGSGAHYPNCAAARAAGAAPIRRGQPGYRPGLDRDGDGIACE